MPLLIAGGVALLLVVLLLARIRLQVDYEERFVIRIRYLFFVYRMKEKKKGKAKTEEKQTENHGARKFIENFKMIYDILKPVLSAVSRKARVDRILLNLVICEEDAAQTALEYGEACAVIFPVSAFLENIFSIKKKNIRITPVFGGAETSVSFSFAISMRLCGALCAILSIIRQKTQDGKENGRAENRKCSA